MVDTRWDNTFDALAGFVAAKARLPARHSGDPDEERLIRWLYYQRQLEQRGHLDSERAQRLDGLWQWRQPPRGLQRADRWAGQLADLRAFIERHDRLPTRAEGVNDQERSLALFVNRQRRAARERTLTTERAEQLEQTAPGWNRKPEPWRHRQIEEHRTAARKRLRPHRQVILAGLASGRTAAEMTATTGVPHQLMFAVARYDPQWSRQLEDALIQGRQKGLDHGTLSAYRHGCRCLPCRQIGRSHHKPRRSRAKTPSS